MDLPLRRHPIWFFGRDNPPVLERAAAPAADPWIEKTIPGSAAGDIFKYLALQQPTLCQRCCKMRRGTFEAKLVQAAA